MKIKIFSIIFIIIVCKTISAQKNIICTSDIIHESSSFDTFLFRNSHTLENDYFLWNNGQNIKIKFLNGSKALQQRVKSIAKQWEKYANIHFDFIDTEGSYVRLQFNDLGFISSFPGSLSIRIPQSELTAIMDSTAMNYPQLFKGLVLHLFGHILGLNDEVGLPKDGNEFNIDTLKAMFTNEDNRNAYLDKYSINRLNSIKYDSQSIMLTCLPKYIASNYPIKKWNIKISESDKKLISLWYPKKIEEQKKMCYKKPLIEFFKLGIINNKIQEGISFYPSISISDTCKSNTLIFFIVLVDKHGIPIVQQGEYFSINKQVGTFKKYKHHFYPVGKINYNSNCDLELFIPYTAILKNKIDKSVFAIFKVYYKNYDNEGWLYKSEKFEVKL